MHGQTRAAAPRAVDGTMRWSTGCEGAGADDAELLFNRSRRKMSVCQGAVRDWASYGAWEGGKRRRRSSSGPRRSSRSCGDRLLQSPWELHRHGACRSRRGPLTSCDAARPRSASPLHVTGRPHRTRTPTLQRIALRNRLLVDRDRHHGVRDVAECSGFPVRPCRGTGPVWYIPPVGPLSLQRPSSQGTAERTVLRES